MGITKLLSTSELIRLLEILQSKGTVETCRYFNSTLITDANLKLIDSVLLELKTRHFPEVGVPVAFREKGNG